MRLLFVIFMLALNISCGDSLFTSSVKRYYFAVEPATSENHRIFSELFGEFNNHFRSAPLLNLIGAGDLSEDETSSIKMTRGLIHRDGKLGWGRWLMSSKLNSRSGFLQQPHKIRKDIYMMELEFDAEYVEKRYYSNNHKDQQQLRTLFLHELGHGFQMNHDRQRSSVMYPEIDDGYKDFRSFYLRVEDFLRR